jgi:hypothetical protein
MSNAIKKRKYFDVITNLRLQNSGFTSLEYFQNISKMHQGYVVILPIFTNCITTLHESDENNAPIQNRQFFKNHT